MTPALVILLAWLLFAGSHLLMSMPTCRQILVRSLGERNFVVFYTVVAALTLGVLSVAIALYGKHGAMGPDLAAVTAPRWGLGAIALSGFALMAAGLLNYPASPMAVLAGRLRNGKHPKTDTPLQPPGVVDRITRHPFFVGFGLLMGAHALLAGTASQSIFFAGLAALGLIGIPLQDYKLKARHGAAYADYLKATSAIPFAGPAPKNASAIKAAPGWLPIIACVSAGVLLHPLWRYGNGAVFLVAVTGGACLTVARQLRRK